MSRDPLDENPFRSRPAPEAARPDRPGVTVIGTGIAHPPTAIRIGELGPKLATFSPEKARMGYEEFVLRHMGAETVFVDEERKGPAYFMARAAEKAMERAGVTASDVDAVVVTTATGTDVIAGIRGLVLHELGMYEKHTIELCSACTGFLDALLVGRDRAAVSGDTVLVVAGDAIRSRCLDPQDYVTQALFGEGASAAVLGACEPGFGLKEGQITTNSDWRADAMTGPDGWFVMDAKALGTRIPAAFAEQFVRGCRRNGFDPARTVAIPHQANGRLLEVLRQKLGLEPGLLVNVFHKYGNCGNPSIGIALHHAFRDGLLRRGTDAVLFGAGGGFNFGHLGLTADRELPEQTPFRVLFVDDDRRLAHAMAEEMSVACRADEEFRTLFTFHPVVEYSGEDGLRRMAEDASVNLVVTDQRMGEMSGARMVETLKRRARNVGYVLVTGFADEDRTVIEKAGFSRVLGKPCPPALLWETLKEGARALRNRDVNLGD